MKLKPGFVKEYKKKHDEIVNKWWVYMADTMDTNPDNSPVSIPLPEVFHID